MRFRKDINGLRAFAVLAVVLYHFRITGFSGGFSGVDIFFVISGYLMTSIIFTRLAKEQFSLIDFYLHRARRIIPALAVLCVFFIIMGYFYLLTPDYRELMQLVRKVILFISNLAFYKETDYFGTIAQENWLLHTWSLSVEWQFYLLYPIIILVLIKLFRLPLTKKILAFIAVSSFITSVVYTPINPAAAFYLLPTRAWEMLAGGLVFLYPLNINEKYKKTLNWIGLSIIVGSIIFLTNKHWPGSLAIIPIIGSVLVLYSMQDNMILNNPLAQGIGKISYSVYLWHWPVAVLLYITGYLTNAIFVMIGILVSFLLGLVSYYFIEIRFKLKANKLFEVIKYLLIILFVLISAASMGSFVKHSKLARNNFLFSDTFRSIDDIVAHKNTEITKQCLLDKHYTSSFPECRKGNGPIKLIVLGDSHAGALFPAIYETNTKGSALYWASMACPIIKGVHFYQPRASCENFIKDKVSLLENKDNYQNTPVIFINYLTSYFKDKDQLFYITHPANDLDDFKKQYREAYIKTMCDIAKIRPVYVLKPIPTPEYNVPKKMTISLITSKNISLKSSIKKYQEESLFVIEVMEQAKRDCGIQLLDPVPYLCPNGKECLLTNDNKPLYFDDNHLSHYGIKFLEPLFKQILN
ncbi:acyltransferase [Entomomonas moraniae]|uniref:Acyltransferase n=1 Tax=Entomomonas moraniae TaxID=2213226 RepID=A0A3Q9JKC1_9GAMM|nr:acyltransferase family protein [Entomomonas moraniae]AZS51593.1 acyltransferase [Entomomonas moraniae]